MRNNIFINIIIMTSFYIFGFYIISTKKLPVGNLGGGEVTINENLSYIIGGVFFLYSTFILYAILKHFFYENNDKPSNKKYE